MIKKIVLASLLVAVTSGSSFAATPWIDATQQFQGGRIWQGVQSGQLTYGETKSLMKGQAYVQYLKNQANADGIVTPAERAQIRAAQAVQSARIFWMKHN